MRKPHNPITLKQLIDFTTEVKEEETGVIVQLAQKNIKKNDAATQSTTRQGEQIY